MKKKFAKELGICDKCGEPIGIPSIHERGDCIHDPKKKEKFHSKRYQLLVRKMIDDWWEKEGHDSFMVYIHHNLFKYLKIT
jgi:hypothetical protein